MECPSCKKKHRAGRVLERCLRDMGSPYQYLIIREFDCNHSDQYKKTKSDHEKMKKYYDLIMGN